MSSVEYDDIYVYGDLYEDPHYDDEVVNGPRPTWSMSYTDKIRFIRQWDRAENKNGYLWMCDYFAYWGWR